MFRELVNRNGEAQVLHLIGRTLRHLKKPDEAEERLLESMRLKTELGDPVRIAITQHEVARLREMQGRFQEAAELYEKAIASLVEHGAVKDAANAKWRFSQLLTRYADRIQAARQLNYEAVEAYRKQGRRVKYELALRDLRRLDGILAEQLSQPVSVEEVPAEKLQAYYAEDVRHEGESPIGEITRIHELLVNRPIDGAAEFAKFVSQHEELRKYRADIETKRSELLRIDRDKNNYGDTNLGEWSRAVHFLMDMCEKIEGFLRAMQAQE